jgi:hypothetical protein
VIVFTHSPKTAGTTFQFILENSLGILGQEVADQRGLDVTRENFPGTERCASGDNGLRDWKSEITI